MENRIISVFKSLRSKRFSQLWACQADVFLRYCDEHQESSDVGIELPTGSGKTLVGSVLGESLRRDGKRVAVLCANVALAKQFQAEAESLNIRAVVFEGGEAATYVPGDVRAYERAEAIGIMNYWVYFNTSPRIKPAQILIFDDAHLAEGALSGLTELSVSSLNTEHEECFDRLVEVLAGALPESRALRDLKNDTIHPDTPTDLVSFFDAIGLEEKVRNILEAHCTYENKLIWGYKAIRDSLKKCCWFVGPEGITFRPYIPQAGACDYFSQPEQRIYLSATLGAVGDLQRRLGAGKIERLRVQEEYQDYQPGTRLIGFVDRMEDLKVDERRKFAIKYANSVGKSLWMCPSLREAQQITEALKAGTNQPVFELDRSGQKMEEFKAASEGHLVVAGRYEGMDFPGDCCRLAVLVGNPKGLTPVERFFSEHLRDSEFLDSRIGYRLQQAFGRCVRSSSDFAVYLVLGDAAARYLEDDDHRALLPKSMWLEIEFGLRTLSESTATFLSYAKDFLKGNNAKYGELLDRMSVPALSRDSASSEADTTLEVAGWLAMFSEDNYDRAAECFRDRVVELSGTAQSAHRAWWDYCLGMAEYLRFAEHESQDALKKCVRALEAATHAGTRAAYFNRLRRSINRIAEQIAKQAGAKRGSPETTDYVDTVWESLLKRASTLKPNSPDFEKWAKVLKENLKSGKHDQVALGLEELGNCLGAKASRPEGQGKADCIWRFEASDLRVTFTLECKIEHKDAKVIAIKDANQAQGQAKDVGSEGQATYPFIVTHLTAVDKEVQARLSPGKVLHLDAIMVLADLAIHLLKQVWSSISKKGEGVPEGTAAGIKCGFPSGLWIDALLDSKRVLLDEPSMKDCIQEEALP
jgi:hypothetical protein